MTAGNWTGHQAHRPLKTALLSRGLDQIILSLGGVDAGEGLLAVDGRHMSAVQHDGKAQLQFVLAEGVHLLAGHGFAVDQIDHLVLHAQHSVVGLAQDVGVCAAESFGSGAVHIQEAHAAYRPFYPAGELSGVEAALDAKLPIVQPVQHALGFVQPCVARGAGNGFPIVDQNGTGLGLIGEGPADAVLVGAAPGCGADHIDVLADDDGVAVDLQGEGPAAGADLHSDVAHGLRADQAVHLGVEGGLDRLDQLGFAGSGSFDRVHPITSIKEKPAGDDASGLYHVFIRRTRGRPWPAAPSLPQRF